MRRDHDGLLRRGGVAALLHGHVPQLDGSLVGLARGVGVVLFGHVRGANGRPLAQDRPGTEQIQCFYTLTAAAQVNKILDSLLQNFPNRLINVRVL